MKILADDIEIVLKKQRGDKVLWDGHVRLNGDTLYQAKITKADKGEKTYHFLNINSEVDEKHWPGSIINPIRKKNDEGFTFFCNKVTIPYGFTHGKEELIIPMIGWANDGDQELLLRYNERAFNENQQLEDSAKYKKKYIIAIGGEDICEDF